MLVDTDVLIWHLRGYPQATQKLDSFSTLTISAVTYMELLQGLRNKAEMNALQQSLAMRHTQRLPLTSAITERAIALMEGMVLSDGLQLGDALIAATALEHQLSVLTGNAKHFSAIANLRIEKFEIKES
jgi:predicted nucleic acid-binding protein